MTTKLDYALRLAELDKVCQGDPSGMNHLFDCAGGCRGTGRVYLLGAEVRVKCTGCEGSGKGYNPFWLQGKPAPDCSYCQGRGWTPSTDGDVLAQALWPILREFSVGEGEAQNWVVTYQARRTTGRKDYLRAAWRALVAAERAKE